MCSACQRDIMSTRRVHRRDAMTHIIHWGSPNKKTCINELLHIMVSLDIHMIPVQCTEQIKQGKITALDGCPENGDPENEDLRLSGVKYAEYRIWPGM